MAKGSTVRDQNPDVDFEDQALDAHARMERFLRAAEFVMRSPLRGSDLVPLALEYERSTPPLPAPASHRAPPMRPIMPTLNDDGTLGDAVTRSAYPSWSPKPPTPSSIPPSVRHVEPLQPVGPQVHEFHPRRKGTVALFLLMLTTLASFLALVVYGASSGRPSMIAAAHASGPPPACTETALEAVSENATTFVAPAPTLPPQRSYGMAMAVPVSAPTVLSAAAEPGPAQPSAASTPTVSQGSRLDDANKTATMLRQQLGSGVH